VDIGDSRRDGAASNSVLITWQISFEHIQRVRPSAARLLSLMSLFDRQGIPESLLDGHYQDGNDIISDFEEDLSTLISFSLIAADMDGHQFGMHRLVQFSTRKWLELRGKLDGWKEKYIILMADNYPEGWYENWKVCQELFPHASALTTYRPTDGNTLQAWATVLHNAALYAKEMGHYQKALDMDELAVNAREHVLGPDHPDTLMTINNLATALSYLDRDAEAEAMLRQNLGYWETLRGPEHPDTLTCANNLAAVLKDQGKHEEAETMYRQNLYRWEKLRGLEDPRTLMSANNLALLLASQGKCEEAETMHQRVLEGHGKVPAPEHPHTASGLSRLGLILHGQGKYQEAEIILRQVLESYEKVLGHEHPDTLVIVYNVASVLEDQGRLEEAETLSRRALRGYENILGLEHPNTLASICLLRRVLEGKGKYEEAEALH
jgi:tetratricopeptide (TPR) repeat protein